ncbi:MAG: glycosyltransferase family 4 protein [Porticoccaceae bacterium]|nr:glycosyltransferase family 4 protein [Porticoccaceae bacterium]
MKVIHVLKGKANPETMNGVNKVVHNLATEQLRLGIDVEVWGLTETPDVIRHQHDYPLKLFLASKVRFLLSTELNITIDAINQEDVMFHLHSVFLPELFSVSKRLKRNKISWVLSPHSGYNSRSMEKNKIAKAIYMRFFEKALIAGATRIHAVGKSEVSDIKNLYPSAEVILIPNGQSCEDVKFVTVACEEPNERPIFGFCGRLAWDHKGLDLLIQGFSAYKQMGGKGELWLIGDGPDKGLLSQLAEKAGASASIRFLGTRFGDHKLSTIKKMDIFVHTSRWEGMPIAVLEAAALAKPLLISEEANMGEYVRQYSNGIVLSENTPEIIAKEMGVFGELFYAKKLEGIGRRSLNLIEEKLNWTAIADSVLKDLYM